MIGLRLLSATDKRVILNQAEETIREQGATSTDENEAYNDALVRLYVARGMCDPNDVSKPSSFFPYPDLQVFDYLTEAGARGIFDALQRFEVETANSLLYPECSPDEIVELVQRIEGGQLELLGETTRARVTRHLRYVLDDLREGVTAEDAEAFADLLGLQEA